MTATQPIRDDIIIPILVSGLFKTAELLKDLKNASTEILELADDIEILSEVLVQFEEALESARPIIGEANKQGAGSKTGKRLVKKIKRTIDSMMVYEKLVSMATKDSSLTQKFLARLKWLRIKGYVTAAHHTIQKLSSHASMFLLSVMCQQIIAQIAELRMNRAEVPAMLRRKLKVAMQMCQREKRKAKAASDGLGSVGEAALEEMGLLPKDIRQLQRMGDRITEKATTAVNKAQRYTGDDLCQQKKRASSRKRQPSKYATRRSARSPSPRGLRAPRTRQFTAASLELSPPSTSQLRTHGDIHGPQRVKRPRPNHTEREHGQGNVMASPPSFNRPETTALRPEIEFEIAKKLRSNLGSTKPVSSSHSSGSSDTFQPSSAKVIPNPLTSFQKRNQGFHGARVRDNGTTITVEESEWPAEVPSPSDCSRIPSEQSIASLEHPDGRNLSTATGPHACERPSLTVSQDARHRKNKDPNAAEKRAHEERFGEEYKPCGLFTDSDLEERRRRGRGGRGSDASHAG